jgi:sigma-B regulation protein RsbQ
VTISPPAPELSPSTDVLRRNNVTQLGDQTARPIVLAHGFGCGQEAWKRVVPHFTGDHRVVLFDHVGSGGSDFAAYDHGKYDSLHGYATDLLEILDALDLRDAIVVGHSVAAMMAVLAANRDSSRIGALVLLGPSPRYVNDDGYIGGFEQADIDGLLDTLDANYLGWSREMAPMIVGNVDRPELGEELTESFCSTDPAIARHFAHVTFLSDNRADLLELTVPTLVLQSTDDIIAPTAVGQYVHGSIAGSRFRHLAATGHCAHLSGADEVAREIRGFLS